jgi:hypothetical protein
MLGIFVKTTWNYNPIPGDYTGMPQFPTMVSQLIFYFKLPALILDIPAVLFI